MELFPLYLSLDFLTEPFHRLLRCFLVLTKTGRFFFFLSRLFFFCRFFCPFSSDIGLHLLFFSAMACPCSSFCIFPRPGRMPPDTFHTGRIIRQTFPCIAVCFLYFFLPSGTLRFRYPHFSGSRPFFSTFLHVLPDCFRSFCSACFFRIQLLFRRLRIFRPFSPL